MQIPAFAQQPRRLFKGQALCIAVVCLLNISIKAQAYDARLSDDSITEVVISADNRQLLSTFHKMAVEHGLEIKCQPDVAAPDIAAIERSLKGNVKEILLLCRDAGKGLAKVLKRTNHILEFDNNVPPRLGRVVLLGVGDSHSDIAEAQTMDSIASQTRGTDANYFELDLKPESRTTGNRFDTLSLEPSESISKLEQMLGDTRPELRKWAINNLGELAVSGHQQAMLALGQVIFSDPLPSVRIVAVNWLRLIGSEASLNFLDAARRDKSEEVRQAVSGD